MPGTGEKASSPSGSSSPTARNRSRPGGARPDAGSGRRVVGVDQREVVGRDAHAEVAQDLQPVVPLLGGNLQMRRERLERGDAVPELPAPVAPVGVRNVGVVVLLGPAQDRWRGSRRRSRRGRWAWGEGAGPQWGAWRAQDEQGPCLGPPARVRVQRKWLGGNPLPRPRSPDGRGRSARIGSSNSDSIGVSGADFQTIGTPPSDREGRIASLAGPCSPESFWPWTIRPC
jgi:hypothetical protein